MEKAHNSQQIKDFFSLHRRRYGPRRLVVAMSDREGKVGRDFVRKVLVGNALKLIQPRSFVPPTTDSRHTPGYSPSLLLDRPRPTGLHQVWVSDITYLPLATGKWLYLSAWVDLCRVAGAVPQGGRLVSGRSDAGRVGDHRPATRFVGSPAR